MANTGKIVEDSSRIDDVTNIDNLDSLPMISAHEFQLLADNIPILCWMAKADGSIIWYNRPWHDYCGSTPDDMAREGWHTDHSPEGLPSVIDQWTQRIAAGTFFEMTSSLRGADGVDRPFLMRVQPSYDTSGSVRWWFGANIDVSSQSDAQAELRAANLQKHAIAAEREAILEQLDEGVIVTDPMGRITFVNEAATHLHGVARLDVDPDGYTEVYSLWTEDGQPHPAETLPLTRAVRNHETVVDTRWRIRRPDGTEVLALGNAKPIYAEDKSLIGAVLTIRDDTLRHAAEAALAQAVRLKDVMLQEVNHRVKNNLQLVTSLLSLQADRTNLPAVRTSLLEARTRLGVIANTHQQLYATTQHDSVNLSTYLHDLATETLVALDGEKRIDLTFHGENDIAVSLDNAVPIALVVNELLTNAVKYAFVNAARGHITIQIARNATDIVISLADDGAGLPAGFNPAASAGLGMLIVTALIGQIDGSLTIIEQPAGAGFCIALPEKRISAVL